MKVLDSPQKRKAVLTELWKPKAQIAFLQETHFQGEPYPIFRDRHHTIGYHCGVNAKSKCVSILFCKSIQWSCSDIKRDDAGRFLLVKGLIGKQVYTFANVYFPN